MPSPATMPSLMVITRLSKWFTRPFSWVTTTTVVVVTHERGLVNHFDKRVITINDGIVAGDGMGQYEVAR